MSLTSPDFLIIGLTCSVCLPFPSFLQTPPNLCRINADHTAVHSGLPCGSPSSSSLDSLSLLMLSLSNHQGSWHLLSTCNVQELLSTWSVLNTHETVLCSAETTEWGAVQALQLGVLSMSLTHPGKPIRNRQSRPIEMSRGHCTWMGDLGSNPYSRSTVGKFSVRRKWKQRVWLSLEFILLKVKLSKLFVLV